MRVLLLDIETAPMIVFAWQLKTDYISIDKIIKPGYTLCYAAKWLGEKKVMFDSVRKSGEKQMLTSIHALIDQADIIVTFNGIRFDEPTLMKEFVKHGMTPPSPAKHLDIYREVKGVFRFESNKLEWVARSLGLGGKVHHKGMQLWVECMGMDGNAATQNKSWRTMEEYNRYDVVLLENVYLKVRPYIKNHPNMALDMEGNVPVCRACCSPNIKSRGERDTAATPVGLYRRYRCADCGTWGKFGDNLLSKEKRKSLLRRA